MHRKVLVTLSALIASAALAHAELQSSTPEDGESLGTAPTAVELVFSESIQMGFSTFKVYPLPEEVAAAEADEAMAAEMAPLDDHADDDAATDDAAGDDHGHDAAADDTEDDTADDTAGDDAAGDDHAAADGAAAAFVEEVLSLEGDEAERVDEEVTAQGSEVTLTLRGELEPGGYVAMWSALSADGHPIEGFVTFSYRP